MLASAAILMQPASFNSLRWAVKYQIPKQAIPARTPTRTEMPVKRTSAGAADRAQIARPLAICSLEARVHGFPLEVER